MLKQKLAIAIVRTSMVVLIIIALWFLKCSIIEVPFNYVGVVLTPVSPDFIGDYSVINEVRYYVSDNCLKPGYHIINPLNHEVHLVYTGLQTMDYK